MLYIIVAIVIIALLYLCIKYKIKGLLLRADGYECEFYKKD